MRTSSKNLYKTIFHANLTALRLIETIRAESLGEPDLKELADTCFAVKKSLELIKELTVQLNNMERLTSNMICALWMNTDGESIRTVYCTATPVVKMMVKTPNRRTQPDEYAEFCRHFGVTEELIQSGAFQVHWPSMVELISANAEQGKPLPPGCDPSSQYPVHSVTCRKTKDILDAKDLPDIA